MLIVDKWVIWNAVSVLIVNIYIWMLLAWLLRNHFKSSFVWIVVVLNEWGRVWVDCFGDKSLFCLLVILPWWILLLQRRIMRVILLILRISQSIMNLYFLWILKVIFIHVLILIWVSLELVQVLGLTTRVVVVIFWIAVLGVAFICWAFVFFVVVIGVLGIFLVGILQDAKFLTASSAWLLYFILNHWWC